MRRNKFAFEEAEVIEQPQQAEQPVTEVKTEQVVNVPAEQPTEEVVEEAPIVMQDLSDDLLSIDKDQEELGNDSDAIQDASSDAEELQGYSNIMEKNLDNGMSPDAVEAIQLATESICKRLGIVKKNPKISLEAFEELKNNKESTRLAFEENNGIISRTLKAIWEAIKKAIAKVKEFINKIFNVNKNLEKNTKKNEETAKTTSNNVKETPSKEASSKEPEKKGKFIEDGVLCTDILSDIYAVKSATNYVRLQKDSLELLENTGYLYSSTEKMIDIYEDLINLLDDVRFNEEVIDKNYLEKAKSIFKTIKSIKDRDSIFELNKVTISFGKEISYDDRDNIDVSAQFRNLYGTLRSFRNNEDTKHALILPILDKQEIRQINSAIFIIIKNNERLITSSERLNSKFKTIFDNLQLLANNEKVTHAELMFRSDCVRSMDYFVTRLLPAIISAHTKPINGFNKWVAESLKYYA